MAQRLGFDGAVAEAMTPAHDRLYRQAFRRIEGFSPLTGNGERAVRWVANPVQQYEQDPVKLE